MRHLSNPQKSACVSAVWGLAENAQETCKHDPGAYDVEHVDDFSWSAAVESARGTFVLFLREDGIAEVFPDALDVMAEADPDAVAAYAETLVGHGWTDSDSTENEIHDAQGAVS